MVFLFFLVVGGVVGGLRLLPVKGFPGLGHGSGAKPGTSAIFTVKSPTGTGAMDRGYHRAGDALEHRAENGVAAGKCTAGPRDRLLFGPLSPANRG